MFFKTGANGVINKMVKEYNKYVKALGKSEDMDDYYAARLTFEDAANDAQINELAEYFHIPVPQDLVDFYKSYGSLIPAKDAAHEDCVIKVFSPAYLLKKLKEPEKWGKCRSLGLIDMIRFSWGERDEFNEYISKEMRLSVNDQYQCIGWYRLDWGLEEAYYIYFDKSGNFGAVRYHQDEFNELMDQLKELLKGNGAVFSLENLLQKALQEMKNAIDTD